MGEHVVFLVIFDTYDVMYNWSISLLPPIVLHNLFNLYQCLQFLKLMIFNCGFSTKETYAFVMQEDKQENRSLSSQPEGSIKLR